MRVGVPREFFYDGLDPAVRGALEAASVGASALGATVREVPLAVSTDRTVFRAEAYASHAVSIAKSPERYLPETLAKLRLGAQIDAATYIVARRRLAELRRGMAPCSPPSMFYSRPPFRCPRRAFRSIRQPSMR